MVFVLYYILYITIIIHILLLYIYYYYILYSSDLSSSFLSLLTFPPLPIYLLFSSSSSVLFFSFQSSPLQIPPNISSIPFPSPHSFYTCRYLHILIYILPAFHTFLSSPPNIPSLIQISDPARSIGVDG